MDDTDLIDANPHPQPEGERALMHVLYGMHTIAWISMGTLALIAVVVNYLRRGDTRNLAYAAHHQYMIRTFWWTLLWLLLTSPLYLLFILPGVLAQSVVGIWYLYRCLRGWMRFADQRLP